MIRKFFKIAVILAFSHNLVGHAHAFAESKKRVEEFRIVIVGDSLSEGYGVIREKAYPILLEEKLKKIKPNVVVINASVSGSTSASAVKRVEWQMKMQPNLMILELGANDGLRGLKVNATEENLQKAISLAKSQGVQVVLAGMKLPKNYGEKYRQEFEKLFAHLAKKNAIPFIPFILDGVGGVSKFNQADGIHPNEAGHDIIAENVYNFLKDIL